MFILYGPYRLYRASMCSKAAYCINPIIQPDSQYAY